MAKRKLKVIEITEFTPDLCEKYQSKPGDKVRIRIFCKPCNKSHILHFGEFMNALSTKPRKPHNIGYGRPYPQSLQDIIDFYAWKYCRSRKMGMTPKELLG